MDFMKTENFCSARDIIKIMRKQATEWEKIFAKDHLIKDYYINIQGTLKTQ